MSEVDKEPEVYTDESGLDRIVTLPNAITLVRLLCVPLFAWLVLGAHDQIAASVVLGGLGATDWVDGHLARRLRQVSTLGKVIDPLADRVLIATSVIVVIIIGGVPLWFGLATLVREAIVSIMVLILAALGAKRIDVLLVGKAGTFALMFAYPAFLLSHGSAKWQVPIHDFAWVVGLGGLALSWIAALSYLKPAYKALAEGRAARREKAK